MHDYLLTAIGCLCIGTVGLSAGKCSQTVWARRDTFYVAQGGSGSLSCVVQHCGDPWTGNWIFQISSQDKLIESTERYHLTNVTVSENKTRLFLNFLKVNQSDEGFYGCKITWGTGVIERGHLTYLNITAAVPSERNLLHRFLVCASPFLCLTISLGLAYCLRSRVKHQVLPGTQSTQTAEPPHWAPTPLPRRPIPKKRSTSPRKVPPKSEQRAEVLYADISQDLMKQLGAMTAPAHSTVYSSVRFS